MDLVRDAGIDVSDWANFSRGPKWAAANPKYCYAWAFVRPEHVVVLNVWYDDLREQDGVITLEGNFREHAAFHSQAGGKAVWQKRAAGFDHAVHTAASAPLPIRTIINDGVRRERGNVRARASEVKARVLDPVPWQVTSYDPDTGDFVLTRGAIRFADQFSLAGPPDSPTEMRSASGMVYVRDQAVRQFALNRAAGRCECCHVIGFTMDDGSAFLETHHVIPLSEGGPDSILNVVALCPNHHREAHYGSQRAKIREQLQALLSSCRLTRSTKAF
jgi:5-methylcytosine-specific restriction protein A